MPDSFVVRLDVIAYIVLCIVHMPIDRQQLGRAEVSQSGTQAGLYRMTTSSTRLTGGQAVDETVAIARVHHRHIAPAY